MLLCRRHALPLLAIATVSSMSFLIGFTIRDIELYNHYKLVAEQQNIENIRVRQDDVFFFNRVQKTGSENFVAMMQWLEAKNGFTHIRCDHCYPDIKMIPEDKKKWQVKFFRKHRMRPLSFDRHMYFFDFAKYGMFNPTWFSVVRDPIRKFESKFYYSRNTPQGFMYDKIAKKGYTWITKPYFCGQDEECLVLGSEWALQTAKENVEKWYPVVGVLEELNSTVAVLEKKFPLFFDGFSELYKNELKDSRRNHGLKYERLSPEAEMMVRANFSMEIEFYDFITQRLRQQVREEL